MRLLLVCDFDAALFRNPLRSLVNKFISTNFVQQVMPTNDKMNFFFAYQKPSYNMILLSLLGDISWSILAPAGSQNLSSVPCMTTNGKLTSAKFLLMSLVSSNKTYPVRAHIFSWQHSGSLLNASTRIWHEYYTFLHTLHFIVTSLIKGDINDSSLWCQGAQHHCQLLQQVVCFFGNLQQGCW